MAPQPPGLEAFPRRLLTCSVLGLAVIVLVGGLPLWLALGLGVDLIRRDRYATIRCALFLAWVALCELFGVLGALALWLGWVVGLGRASYQPNHYALQAAWGEALVSGTLELYGMTAQVEGAQILDGRPVLLLVRHSSVADGVLALKFICRAHGYRLRYVVKRELLYDPCLDIVGHRIPNAFVRRDGGDSAAQVEAVTALLDDLGPSTGVLIFPEGTRFTHARKAQAIERLRAGGQAGLAERAARFRHLLPPRPGGTLGLLQQNPGVDVVIVGHTGLDGATRLWDFVRGGLVGATLRLRLWRYAADELPSSNEAKLDWLYARWAEVDTWIELGGGPRGPGRG